MNIKYQRGIAHLIPILIVGVLAVGGYWFYKNYSANPSSSDASMLPDTTLQTQFPNTYTTVKKMTADFGAPIATKIATKLEDHISDLETLYAGDGGDQTRTSNKGQIAYASSYQQEGCIYRGMTIFFQQYSTVSSSGSDSGKRGNLYVYEWNSCTGIGQSIYGLIPVGDAYNSKFVPDGTVSAKFVMRDTPITGAITATANCTITGSGFIWQNDNHQHYNYPNYEYLQKNEHYSRGGTVACNNNSVIVAGKSYPIEKTSGYLDKYAWSITHTYR